jgi:hypothetical protein
MIFFLTTQPIWVSGAIIVGLGTLLSVLGTVLVRRYTDVKRLTPDTEIAGFKFGTIGVLYAVLLAFAIIVVWEKFSDAELDVVQEAGAAENIYRLSQGLSDNARRRPSQRGQLSQNRDQRRLADNGSRDSGHKGGYQTGA